MPIVEGRIQPFKLEGAALLRAAAAVTGREAQMSQASSALFGRLKQMPPEHLGRLLLEIRQYDPQLADCLEAVHRLMR